MNIFKGIRRWMHRRRYAKVLNSEFLTPPEKIILSEKDTAIFMKILEEHDTAAAVQELESGRGMKFDNVTELLIDLRREEDE